MKPFNAAHRISSLDNFLSSIGGQAFIGRAWRNDEPTSFVRDNILYEYFKSDKED